LKYISSSFFMWRESKK